VHLNGAVAVSAADGRFAGLAAKENLNVDEVVPLEALGLVVLR